MPAPGSVWAGNTWDVDAWAADTWADAGSAPEPSSHVPHTLSLRIGIGLSVLLVLLLPFR